ncbi:MAG: VOC family protein [Deltaproteobacteria bacterium]|nr:VOC family protein [Deltaproteobacteria bacterium]
MPPHLTHVALFVREVAATVEFYRDYVGLHVVHDRTDEGVRVVWLSERPSEPDFVIVAIGIAPAPAAQPAPFAHFGYDLPSRAAVDAMAARAAVAGVLAQAPRDAGPIVGYFCLLCDPDGNLVEFSHGQPINPRQVGR